MLISRNCCVTCKNDSQRIKAYIVEQGIWVNLIINMSERRCVSIYGVKIWNDFNKEISKICYLRKR